MSNEKFEELESEARGKITNCQQSISALKEKWNTCRLSCPADLPDGDLLDKSYSRLIDSYEKLQNSYSSLLNNESHWNFPNAKPAAKENLSDVMTQKSASVPDLSRAILSFEVIDTLQKASEILKLMFADTEGSGREIIDRCDSLLSRVYLETMPLKSRSVH